MSDTLQDRVTEALNNATDNSYPVWDTEDFLLACDMVQFSSELEDEDPSDLLPCIQVWRNSKDAGYRPK